VKWEIDIDAGTWKPVSTLWRGLRPNEVGEVVPSGYIGQLRVITANNGRRYAFGQTDTSTASLYIEDGDVFKPFAGHFLIDPSRNLGGRYPALYRTHGGYYLWQDKNGDQMVQPDEIVPTGKMMFAWLDRDLVVWNYGSKFVPTHVDDDGIPHYDFSAPVPTGLPPTGKVMMDDFETQLYTFEPHEINIVRWNKETLAPMWAYRGMKHWAGSLSDPIVRPGLLHGLTQINGVAG